MKVRPPLVGLEHQLMQILWESGPATVDAVHERIARTRDLKEVTVRTILRRLEAKGYLRHDVDGRVYVYRAVEPARGLAARAVKQIIDRFCRGSVEDLVVGLVDARLISRDELKRLERVARDYRGKPNTKKPRSEG